MNVIFLGYRDWAINTFDKVQNHNSINQFIILNTKEEIDKIELSKWDLLVTLGWSDELGPELANNIFSIGLHCAELDRYSYGSPIQLQIIDGIKHTKHRIFPFKHDAYSTRAHAHTREYSHEVDLNLNGAKIFFTGLDMRNQRLE
jgi:methionyl-tRNA formyltransferase